LSGELGPGTRGQQLWSLNILETKYPCVDPDNRATFRVVASDAQKVRVRIGPGFDMQKGPDNVWEVTTTLVIGFH
jgi:hypothetical protein